MYYQSPKPETALYSLAFLFHTPSSATSRSDERKSVNFLNHQKEEECNSV